MGESPDGEPSYTGEVELDRHDNDTYIVRWKIGGRVVNEGVGIYDPRTEAFAAGYVIRGRTREQDTPGVAIWNIDEDEGRMDCVGTFAGRVGNVAYESWARE